MEVLCVLCRTLMDKHNACKLSVKNSHDQKSQIPSEINVGLSVFFQHTEVKCVLDLVITSVPDQTSVSEVLEIDKAGLFTDHRTVFFKLHTLVKALVKTHHSVYDYEKETLTALECSAIT